jgi:hypothetical protein
MPLATFGSVDPPAAWRSRRRFPSANVPAAVGITTSSENTAVSALTRSVPAAAAAKARSVAASSSANPAGVSIGAGASRPLCAGSRPQLTATNARTIQAP